MEIETRQHGNVLEHKHSGWEYWHPVTRVHIHDDETGLPLKQNQLPTGHVTSKKLLAERLYLDSVEVTPIQMMDIGKSLEIGAVQSLIEGLQYHRYAASTQISQEDGTALFYAEWQPNHNNITHRYLIEVRGEDVYVGYFPYDSRIQRLYGIHHKKMEVVKFLHKTYKPDLAPPELTLLSELSIPNVTFNLPGVIWEDGMWRPGMECPDRTFIRNKDVEFFTRSVYGEFVPFESRVFENVNRDPGGYIFRNSEGVVVFEDPNFSSTKSRGKTWWYEEAKKLYPVDSTGYNMNYPEHPWYMFQGATGYVQLFEGKMFCYPDGSIRFLPKNTVTSSEIPVGQYHDEKGNTLDQVFTGYSDLTIVQGDLIAYSGVIVPPEAEDIPSEMWGRIDRHNVEVDQTQKFESNPIKKYGNNLFVLSDCVLTVTHPEHGETKYEAMKDEMLTLLPGTSRPYQKSGGVD